MSSIRYSRIRGSQARSLTPSLKLECALPKLAGASEIFVSLGMGQGPGSLGGYAHPNDPRHEA